jgi:hypothetical protein
MRNGTPRLALTCSRCGKPREGIRHVCVSNSTRSATLRLKFSFGKCSKCKKVIANPLTHNCAPKSDFKARKTAFGKRQKAAERERKREERRKLRAQQPKHEYQSCNDDECRRTACVAWKAGVKEGYDRGFEEGFDAGFDSGLESCPGPHSGS